MLARDEIALSEMFRAQAATRHRELSFYGEVERAFENQRIEERKAEKAREKLSALQRASDEQIAVFRDRLDHYDTATVKALMENEEALDKARQEREKIEASAYRLPDGRMVFKTEDGKRVVDQFERDVPRDAVKPEAIPSGAPSWEKYKSAASAEQRLVGEREDLLRYQQKLDDARDTINKGDVSKKQLDALDADLQASMPDAVKRQLSASGQSRDAGMQRSGSEQLGIPPALGEKSGYKPDPLRMAP